MAKRIKNKTPDILKAKGLGVYDLHYGARIVLNTAKRWADEDDAQNIQQIDLDTVLAICEFLGVTVGDIFEIIEE